MKRIVREKTVAISHLCRRPGCKRFGDYSRGLCSPCYRQTYQYVAKGVTTFEKLERQGKIAPTRPTLKSWLLS